MRSTYFIAAVALAEALAACGPDPKPTPPPETPPAQPTPAPKGTSVTVDGNSVDVQSSGAEISIGKDSAHIVVPEKKK
jgi:hypothetical protein